MDPVQYKNRDDHLAEIAQGCVRCGNSARDELVCQHVMPQTLLHRISSGMDGAKRCVMICKACHPTYQSAAYALEHSQEITGVSPGILLLVWADLVHAFAGPDGNLPKRWLGWYDDFVKGMNEEEEYVFRLKMGHVISDIVLDSRRPALTKKHRLTPKTTYLST